MKTEEELRDEWRTPIWLWRGIEAALGLRFEYDCASRPCDAIVPNGPWKDGCGDGLVEQWPPCDKWANMPYSNVRAWVEKARTSPGVTVLLLPCSPGQRLWSIWQGDSPSQQPGIVMLTGERVRFDKPVDGDHLPDGNGPTRDVCALVFGLPALAGRVVWLDARKLRIDWQQGRIAGI